MGISGSVNYSSAATGGTPGSKTVFYGPNMNISKGLFKKKVQASFGASYNKNTTNGISSSAVWSSRMNFSYAPKPRKAAGSGLSAGSAASLQRPAVDKGATEGKTGVKKIVKVANPLKGKQNMSLMINYMNRLPVALQKQGFSELTVTFNWSYNF
jgi:hypothetical protein